MSKFNLTIGNETETYLLVFDVLKIDIAIKWAHEISQQYQLFEIDRFSNWPSGHITLDYFVEKLNDCVNVVNQYQPNTIQVILTNEMKQPDLNYLHKFFEDLRGPVIGGTPFFNNAPEVVKSALSQFNIVIHEYEHFVFNNELLPYTNHPYATIVGTFHRPRISLEDNDYAHYTYDWRFGTVYINYCEVGKPLLDVFKDNDDVIGDNNIRPLHYYSADFQIKFGPDTLPEVYADRTIKFRNWFLEREEFLNDLGIG